MKTRTRRVVRLEMDDFLRKRIDAYKATFAAERQARDAFSAAINTASEVAAGKAWREVNKTRSEAGEDLAYWLLIQIGEDAC